MTLLAIIVGSVLGTGLRLTLDAVIPHTDAQFPVSTLVINVVGSLALGFLVARVWPTAPAWLRGGLGTGLLGTFTTFSALIASLLTRDGEPLLVAIYLLASLVVGFAAALLGLRLGGRAGGRTGARPAPPIEVHE